MFTKGDIMQHPRQVALDRLNDLIDAVDKQARESARKEVIEWIESHSRKMNTNMYGISLSRDQWLDFKKEVANA